MDDPQGPASAIKTGQEVVGMRTAPTTTTPALGGNPKPLDLESSSPTPEALSDKASPALPIPIPAASMNQKSVEIDMDAAPEQGVERQDTLDSLQSFQSNFRNRRTNTTWSVMSANTDITEVTEPDHATVRDEVNDQHASATRSFTSPCRVDSFPSRPPTRATSFNNLDDEAIGPARNSPPTDIRPLHPEVLRLREMSTSQRSSNRHGRGNAPPISLPIRQKPEGSGTAPRSGLGREDTVTGPSNPHSIPEVDEEDEEVPMTAVDTRRHSDVAEWAQSDPEDWAMDASQRPDENLIQDVCDRTLKQVFGVELHDLVDTGAAPEAFRAVSYCLDELSRIISGSNLASFGISVNEYGRGGGDQGHAPILPAGGGADQNGHGGYGNGGRRTNKRGASDEGDSPENNESNDGDGLGGNGNGNGGKRAKTENPEDQRLSCPFRKRNPVKFNVRDHQNCAVQSFPDVSQLKRHVKFFHKQKAVSPFDCPRCKRNMGAKEALQVHLAVSNDSICTFQETPLSQNPEDGINAKIEDQLNGRRANSKVDTWEILWQTLFPEDPQEAIPDPTFVPPIELDEVHADFRTVYSRDELRRRISEEELSASESDQDIQEHIERVVGICEQYIEGVFSACREEKIGNLTCQARRKRIQKKGRGQKDPSRLDIPMTGAAQVGFTNANDEPGSASSIDTPRSNQSTPWAPYGTQPGLSTAHVSPALGSLTNGFTGFDISGMDVSGANSQAAMTQPDLSYAFLGQPQPNHQRAPSEDSGVGFERTIAFGNNGMQRQAFARSQMPFQNPSYPQQMMQTNGRVQRHAQFGVPTPMPIQTSMPLTMPGASPTGIDSTLLPFSSTMDQNGYGYPPDGGLGNMNNRNHM